MNDSYSKEVMDLKIENVIKPITDHLAEQDKKLDAILAQVMKTNGRVTSLEKVRTGIYWGGSVLVVAAVVVSSLIVYIWNIQTARLHYVLTTVQTLQQVKDSLQTVVNNQTK